jgi:hypothetical protein
MDQVDFRISLWSAASRVDVMSAEVPSEVKCFLDGQIRKVLVSKCDHLALSNKQGELVLASLCEFAKLDASDLRADGRSEFLDLGAFDQEVFEGWIGILAMINVDERLKRRILLAVVPDREVMWILLASARFRKMKCSM